MARPEVSEAPPARRGRAALGGTKERLVRVVARAPVTVRTKLLFAFLVIAALLVLVIVLGLQVLGQANARVGRLDTLQLRSSTYQSLEAHAGDLQQTLGVRDAGAPSVTPYTGGKPLPGGEKWRLADLAIADTLSQVELGADEALFGFTPPPADERALRRIRADYRGIVRALGKITKLDSSGVAGYGAQPYVNAARTAGDDLDARAQNLAFRTRAETQELVAANRSAYTSSRNLFIAVSAGSVALALALGLILSWSLIGPIQRTETRLEEIAMGNFSARLDVPNRDELGSLAANVNRMNDELRRLYGELEAISRHKSEFLANMSHELRTPLNAIIGFSEVLHEQMFGELNERQLEYLDDVLLAARHLLSLINDVLDLSKVEAGRMELELSEVSLPETLETGLTMQEERAREARVTLGLAVDPAAIVVQADERKLRQVLFNLLSNAVTFTPPGGRVDVSARLEDGIVEVAVADTGSGIAPEDQERIFEEFLQARANGDGARPEGTGLGLPLARRFIELHGGRLWVESDPGRGSTFRFTLPARQEA
jgi:signal transduction histidine kinase